MPADNLEFVESGSGRVTKTKMWEVRSVRSGEKLGWIRFWPHWRRYVFAPSNPTIFDAACLTEIVHFLNNVQAARMGK